jgi:hypothetical protein
MYIISYVCTRAKVFGFAMNPGCFYIGFALPFTLMNMNPVRNDRERESKSGTF